MLNSLLALMPGLVSIVSIACGSFLVYTGHTQEGMLMATGGGVYGATFHAATQGSTDTTPAAPAPTAPKTT